ncbi:DUF3768 domain-containing protein [Caulobacter sp.]|uniref:DUF3768 domain-containing protein n=1 Tax=Caulobacter sp. TaxID=78 RepID=UPI0031DE54D6
MTEQDHTAVIAALNDACRAEPGAGWVMTQGVHALPAADQQAAFAAVTAFKDFHKDNNPHGERDCGAFLIGGAKLFWKIDYYDLDLCMASPDPADPAVTKRVLTLMLAEEY